jgi:hypothetical protein
MGKMNELSIVVDRISELTEGFFRCSDAEQTARTAEYKTVLQPALLAAYGAEAPGHLVDPWMADSYSDLYKDRYNVRPREYSYATMKAFMDNVPPLEDFLDDEEDEVDGDRFDPDISKWAAEEDDLDARIREYEDVYGVSAMGQALKFSGMLEGY